MPSEYLCTYEGSEKSQICVPEDFCTDPSVTSYEPNMELADSYYNLISYYDLACASKGEIGFITSSSFVGMTAALLFIPRLADVYGRYRIMFINNLFMTLALAVLLISDNYNVLIWCTFIFGATGTARLQVGALYLYE